MNGTSPAQEAQPSQAVSGGLTGWKLSLARIAVLLGVIGLSVGLYLLRDSVVALRALGYPGIFLVSLFSSATIILPVPGVLFTSFMGAMLNPLLVALLAGTGAALGEMSGYLAGLSGRGVVQRTPAYERIEGWMRRFGPLAILTLAFIPNPLFDLAGMIAGALKMPWWRFLLFCWLGKIAKMLMFAYGGASVLRWFHL